MSLFDNMMMNNGKNRKDPSIKKNIRNPSGLYPTNEGQLREEFSEEIAAENNKTGRISEDGKSKTQDAEKTSFKEEFSEGLVNDVSRFGIQSYSKAGVTFEKLSESQAKINYSGLLAKSGAQEVSGIYGFGSNQKWEKVSTITLNKEGEGNFMAIIPIEQGKNINIAFKDPAENWDNNSGMNYTFVN